MREDLHQLNKEEEKLQRELMNMNLKNIHKHHQVVKANQIDNKIQNTEQLVKKMMGVKEEKQNSRLPLHVKKPIEQTKPLHPGVECLDEDLIQQSLDNLDMLLANINEPAQKKWSLQQLSKQYGIQNPAGQKP